MNSFAETWTPKEEAVLRENYGRVHAKTIGKQLGRSTSAVMHRASRIGLQSRRRWSSDDDQELAALWGEMALGSIAKSLRRTVATVYWRARKLNLKHGCPRGLEYLSGAATRTGYDPKTLRVILKAQGVRLLPAFARPTKAKRHFHVVDPQDVDDALARHHEGAPVQQHARELGMSGDCLRVWLLRARAAGLRVPAPPTIKKGCWHVSSRVVAEVMAWRATLETVQHAAKRLRTDAESLRARLRAAGLKQLPNDRCWWLPRAEVDRVFTEALKTMKRRRVLSATTDSATERTT